MKTKPTLSLILPAYNEAKSIGATIDQIQGYLNDRGIDYELIVSADGDDGTREQVRARGDARIHVVGEPQRRGKGRGIRDGVAISRGEYIGFVDADNKTPIAEFDKMLPLLEKGWEVIVGSRATAGARIETPQPFYRRLGSKGFALIMHMLLGMWSIKDTQCGFKFFQGKVARDLFRRQKIDGYIFDVEILYLARKAGYKMVEVGVRWRDDGDSRLKLVSGNWRNLKDLFRIRFGKKDLARSVEEAPAVEELRRAA